ncbi:MAG: hypothetical protein U5P10_12180 [Spirochaetia bacterium]|nr:hypothetical protein [Spirochaetia bacterium]
MYTRVPYSSGRLLQVQQSAGNIRVYFKGKRLIDHSETQPCVTVGKGQGSFQDWHANFKIKDQVQQKHVLRQLKVTEADERQVVLKAENGIVVQFTVDAGELFIRLQDSKGNVPDFNRLWLH